jgi:hypothetical protein
LDPLRNPFSPGAGSPPPELVGRELVLEQAAVLLGRIKRGMSEKSMLLTGLRGVGKTVLLNEIERKASAQGYRTISIEAHENKALGALIAPQLRKLLYEIDRIAGIGDKVKRGFAVLRAFIGSIKVEYQDMSLGLDVEPEKGSADSGDIEIDMPDLLVAIGEAAADRGTAVALFIDEVQYFSPRELGALIMAMHKIQQRRLPFVLLGAGLPNLPGMAGESKSYAERLFSFPDIGALSKANSMKALQDPAMGAGASFEDAALEEIYRLTKGYPYFLQEWGYLSWNSSPDARITQSVVAGTTPGVIERLDENFFRVRYDRLTPSEKNFLRAMAQLGHGPHRTGEIADALGLKVNSLGPARANLMKKGMIYSPAHGDLNFTVPLFNEFMIRSIPKFSKAAPARR